MSGIRLVTRADDAGMNLTANKATRASVRQGIVRNISLLAPGPQIEHAAETLLDLSSIANFGFHVCLTSEWANLRWGPVAEPETVSSLLREDGSFPADCDELSLLKPNVDEMMAEVDAQFRRLNDLGFTIQYLDAHMGVGSFPGFGEKLAAFADAHGLLYSDQLIKEGVFAEIPGWQGPAEHPGTELADHLSTTEAGTYLLVGHPAFKTEETERLRLPEGNRGEVLLPRNRQRRMFSDIEIVDYCENVGIELMRYSDLRNR
ncbi:MAG: ChbG/HpnK family deacetylase [Spirochaetales bacterium]|jgi:chitin disaccharide deacetylase|nr:ChbG/HpnK family deacetylase [Spirochaetales bacterium]